MANTNTYSTNTQSRTAATCIRLLSWSGLALGGILIASAYSGTVERLLERLLLL
jgi:hypothetical protein